MRFARDLKLGTVSLDGTKVHANASRPSAMSYGHARKVQAELKAEVAALMKRAEAKKKIEARGKAEAEAAHVAKLAAREKRAKQIGKPPRGRPPAPPTATPSDKDQVNFTDEDSRIMPVPRGGFEQAYNAQAAVDIDTLLIVGQAATQVANDKQQWCQCWNN